MSTTVRAVSTTGIYCRPDCSARPLPSNVATYPTAAAAEAAGFRACLRCRPYRSSDPESWVTGPEVVCRAVRLISAGALDDGTEHDLGARVGVSARHLRRLFVQHVGATPDQVARSTRAHFARRLLDDTDLNLLDVASAAGYGSTRQLGREMQRVFRASPRDLRARRRRADRLVADGGLAVRIDTGGPLHWTHLHGFLAARAVPGVETAPGLALRRIIDVSGAPAVLEVSPGNRDTMQGDPGGPIVVDDPLVATVHLPAFDGLIHVVQATRRWLGVDRDAGEAAAVLDDDPVLGRWVRSTRTLRVPGAFDPWEVVVRTVVGQQVSVAAATTIAGRIATHLGDEVRGLSPWQLTHRFPPPERFIDPMALAGCGLTTRRVDTLAALARRIVDGDLTLDGSMAADELDAALVAVPGIGPWSSAYLRLRLGDPDAFPTGDLVLRKVTSTTDTELARLAEAWRPHRATAAIALWASATQSSHGVDGVGVGR